MRGGAVAARRAHNPKVAGSNPAPATRTGTNQCLFPFNRGKFQRYQESNLRPKRYEPDRLYNSR